MICGLIWLLLFVLIVMCLNSVCVCLLGIIGNCVMCDEFCGGGLCVIVIGVLVSVWCYWFRFLFSFVVICFFIIWLWFCCLVLYSVVLVVVISLFGVVVVILFSCVILMLMVILIWQIEVGEFSCSCLIVMCMVLVKVSMFLWDVVGSIIVNFLLLQCVIILVVCYGVVGQCGCYCVQVGIVEWMFVVVVEYFEVVDVYYQQCYVLFVVL